MLFLGGVSLGGTDMFHFGQGYKVGAKVILCERSITGRGASLGGS